MKNSTATINKLMLLVHLLFIFGMILSVGTAYRNSKNYEYFNSEMHRESQLENKAVGIFSHGYTKRIETLRELAISNHDRAEYGMLAFFILAGAYIGLVFFRKSLALTSGPILIVSFISLVTGLITPIFNIVFYKTLPFLGQVVLSNESIGIVGAIRTWWQSGNYVIASVVLLFSFAFPLVKTVAMGWILSFPDNRFSQTMLAAFKLIGSWAMLDVFIVAVTIVVVTINGKDTADAEVQVGFYFFLSYVILSIAATQILLKILTSRSRTVF